VEQTLPDSLQNSKPEFLPEPDQQTATAAGLAKSASVFFASLKPPFRKKLKTKQTGVTNNPVKFRPSEKSIERLKCCQGKPCFI